LRLSLDPTQRFQILQQVVVLWKLLRQFDGVVVPTLRDPNNGLDFLDLLAVRRRYAVEVCGNLGAKIGVDDKSTQDVLWEDIGKRTCFVLDVVVRDVNVLQSQSKVGGGNGSYTPIRLATEYLLLVIRH